MEPTPQPEPPQTEAVPEAGALEVLGSEVLPRVESDEPEATHEPERPADPVLIASAEAPGADTAEEVMDDEITGAVAEEGGQLAEPASATVTAVLASSSGAKRTQVDWLVDYAKTDKCVCRRSGQAMAQGELRVVRRNTASSGFQMAYSYQVVPFFQMLARMAPGSANKPMAATDLLGLAQLTESDRQYVEGLFGRFLDASDDFPPSEQPGAISAVARLHKRPPMDRRFLCPAPGCQKAYTSSTCLSAHKREKHPELIQRKRPRVDVASLAPAAPPQHAVAADSALAAPVLVGAVVAEAPPGAEILSVVASAETVAQPVEVQRRKQLRCPAEGCNKVYSCSSSLYIHKRNKHPELVKPRPVKARAVPLPQDSLSLQQDPID